MPGLTLRFNCVKVITFGADFYYGKKLKVLIIYIPDVKLINTNYIIKHFKANVFLAGIEEVTCTSPIASTSLMISVAANPTMD